MLHNQKLVIYVLFYCLWKGHVYVLKSAPGREVYRAVDV
jgi:hypothetical protein